MNNGSLLKKDNVDMFDVLSNFHNQIIEACKIGETLSEKVLPKSNEIIISGMGGSAIAGNLLKNYCENIDNTNKINITINRSYSYPNHITNDYLASFSSYSGNTEETLSAYKQINNICDKVVVFTTGGKLKELAENNNQPTIILPSGLQPRAAIGYSFFTQLYFMMYSGIMKSSLVASTANSINKVLDLVKSKNEIFKKENPSNPTFSFAKELVGKIPNVISSERYQSVNLRFRGQFQENSKVQAFGSILPEMNHNEINALENKEMSKIFHFILIKDDEENDRNLLRFKFLEETLEKYGYSYSVIKPSSDNLLTNYFELIQYADWTSFWLALLNGKDPSEIKTIMNLKEFMSN
ncbi:bifunctional phosphoglucose/phosphomannose isomerase [Candidatus Kapabacteria bacterium]|nr:bifunctional phosphoglucose/phosphomannose isomerase [Candidatus Kapabacteria bacterium]